MCNQNIYENMIVITDRKLVEGDFPAQIRKVCLLHPKALILREKDLDDEAYKELAGNVMEICKEQGVEFFIHTRRSVSKELGCRNIHLSIPALKELASSPEEAANVFDRISVSCHSIEDVRLAEKCNAARIILGTIFETDCKPGLQGRGLAFVREICSSTDIPVYAIGGIKESNLDQIMSAGAAGGCMMSGFMRY